MKKIYIILFVPIMQSLYAMNYTRWKDYSQYLLKIKTIQLILQSKKISIPLVTMHEKTSGNQTIFLLLVYPEYDYDTCYYENKTNDTYNKFQSLLLDLPKYIDNCNPNKFCLVSCKYLKNNEDAADCLAMFMHQIKEHGSIITTYAFGESAHIVNLATRLYEKEFVKNKNFNLIDIMLHVQSPIYEYSWSLLDVKYEYNKNYSPTSFKHLYHFYTKSALPVALYRIFTYPDRKYRQINNEAYDASTSLPIKNIRILKEDEKNNLVNITAQELKSGIFVSKIISLFKESVKYKINFDLIAKVYTENKPHKETILMVNRFIDIQQGNIFLRYGDKMGQRYRFGSVSKEEVESVIVQEHNLSQNKLNHFIVAYNFESNKDLIRLWNEHKR